MLLEVNDTNFDSEVLERSKRGVVVVGYYSNTCTPCQRLKPKLESVSSNVGDDSVFVKVNVEHNFESSMRNLVRTIPTLVVYKDGEVVQTHRGCSQMTEDEIKNLVNV